MAKKLMKGAEAIGEAAIRAGCRHYFGYPITPQSEIAEYLSRRMPEVGGVFLQAESEVAASNMLFGAAATGTRVMTSSSSPGISLMAEAFSYMVGAEVPAVVVNAMRGGPGLGGILPSQSDYFQATKANGHGDVHFIVLAPASLQESVEHVMMAFPLAEKYRNPVMIVADGLVVQMMESVDFDIVETTDPPDVEDWAATGTKGRRERNLVKSLFLDPLGLEEHNRKLRRKYDEMEENEVRYEEVLIEDDTKLVAVAYGTTSRVVRSVVEELRGEGYPVGLFRPITLYPFAYDRLREISKRDSVKGFMSIEMSTGQMIYDVRLAVQDLKPVGFFGRQGGIIPTPDDVRKAMLQELEKLGG